MFVLINILIIGLGFYYLLTAWAIIVRIKKKLGIFRIVLPHRMHVFDSCLQERMQKEKIGILLFDISIHICSLVFYVSYLSG